MKSEEDPMSKNGKDEHGFETIAGKSPKGSGKRAKPVRAADQHLPGLEPVMVPAVHKAIENYVTARDERMKLTKIEVETKAALMQAMKKAELTSYNVDGHLADLQIDEQVKARLVDDGEEAEA